MGHILYSKYIDKNYPTLHGKILNEVKTINIYDENFLLIKSISNLIDNYIINLEDVLENNQAITFKIITNNVESNFIKILTVKDENYTTC